MSQYTDLIAPPQYQEMLKVPFKKGNISAIEKEILRAIADPVETQVAEFAQQFSRDEAGMRKLWTWVRHNIRYVADDEVNQIVKDPARLVADGAGDCKSMTVFVVAVLECLGLPFTINFRHYPDTDTNHVYAQTYISGVKIIVDTVWHRFNDEKTPYEVINTYHFLEMANVWRYNGIGNVSPTRQAQVVQNMENNLDRLSAQLPSIKDVDLTELSQAEFLTAITEGAVRHMGSNQRAFTPPMVYTEGVMVSGIFSKIKEKIQDVWKKLVNFIFKGPLQQTAPHFLFAFIEGVIDNPEIVRRRNAQLKQIDFIASNTGTTRDTIMATLAAALVKQTGKTPAQIIANPKSTGVNGIGIAPLVIAAVKSLLPIILKIIQSLGKKKEEAPPMGEDTTSDTALLMTKPNPKPSENKPNTPAVDAPEKKDTTTKKSDSGGTMGLMVATAVIAVLALKK